MQKSCNAFWLFAVCAVCFDANLIDLILYIPVDNFSVMLGWVFLS